MKFLKKYYDIEAEQSSGGGTNIAELMAKQGYNSENRPESKEQVEDKGNNEQTGETKVEVQAATASTETKVENVVQEAEKSGTVIPVETKTETQPQTTVSWQEVLKQQQPDTVLKELLGVDDSKIGLLNKIKNLDPKMVQFLNVWESKGDVNAYLAEMTTDYSKMSSENVMRHQLRNEYPEASDRAIDALFKRKVIDSYSLDPEKYSDEEIEEGRLLLDAEADKYRKVLMEKQKDYILPPPPEAKQEAPDNSEAESEAQFESYKAEVSNNPYIKDIFATKQLSIGEGDEVFKFPIEPTKITDVLFDSEKWAATMFDKGLDAKGNSILVPRTQHQALIAAVAVYGMGIFNEYAKHFIAVGGKKVIDPIDNAKPIDTNRSAQSQLEPTSVAEAMAKKGVLR